jgi:hypothetical protein
MSEIPVVRETSVALQICETSSTVEIHKLGLRKYMT